MWNTDNKSEICCILASLILKENNIEITENKLTILLEKAGINYEKFWPNIFIRLSKEFDISELIGQKKKTSIDSMLTNVLKNDNIDNINQEVKKNENSFSQKDSIEEDMGFGLFE